MVWIFVFGRLWYCLSVSVNAIIIIIIVASPKKNPNSSEKEYDDSQYTRIGMLCLSIVLAVISFSAMCSLYETLLLLFLTSNALQFNLFNHFGGVA